VSTVLAIDTASSQFALAYAIDGSLAGSMSRDAAQDHSRLLLGSIDELLGERREQLAGIVVAQGPGSYAGLRVGLATAQGLALALGIAVVGVPTLEAVALACGLDLFDAVHPAGRGEFAVQRFEHGVAVGGLVAETAEALAGRTVAGEGAGALGGLEVGAEERCRAALAARAASFDAAPGADVDAIYLREPNITRPRKALAPGARG
jgi:tRNA threonylcarbamoyladenosine biosynthesis protein TsaB